MSTTSPKDEEPLVDSAAKANSEAESLPATNTAAAKPTEEISDAERTLREAFPNVDPHVVNAVLIASGGKLEPAFNGLLGIVDPSYRPEMPPRPTASSTAAAKQLEEDERLARQLAAEYDETAPAPPPRPSRQRPQQQQQVPEGEEHSFFDDELPVIRDNLSKGFNETKTKFNSWLNDMRKRIDGENESTPQTPPRTGAGTDRSERATWNRGAGRGISSPTSPGQFDADPTLLNDDFSHLHVAGSPTSGSERRPLANPDLFKNKPSPGSGKNVAFSSKPEQIGSTDARTASPTSWRKWEPLRQMEPAPDPFLVGDDEEEEEDEAQVVGIVDSTKEDKTDNAAAAPSTMTTSGERKSGKDEAAPSATSGEADGSAGKS